MSKSDKQPLFLKYRNWIFGTAFIMVALVVGIVVIPTYTEHYNQIPTCPPNLKETDALPPICIPANTPIHKLTMKDCVLGVDILHNTCLHVCSAIRQPNDAGCIIQNSSTSTTPLVPFETQTAINMQSKSSNSLAPIIYKKSFGLNSGPNGYSYFYDFDIDTHNQTVTIQSIDFIINNTDMTLYNQVDSSIKIPTMQDKYETISLANTGLIVDASSLTYFYNYKNMMEIEPQIQTGEFKLSLLTHSAFNVNIAVNIKIHYLSEDDTTHTVQSDWESVVNPLPIIYCTPETCGTPQSYNQVLNKLDDISKELNVTNSLLLKTLEQCAKDKDCTVSINKTSANHVTCIGNGCP